MKTILIVCKGNIHRSVIAESCIRRRLQESGLDSEYEVISRGVQGTQGTALSKHPNIRQYDLQWSLAEPSLTEFGIEIPVEKSCTPVSETDTVRASVIFAMDRDVLSVLSNSLESQFPDAAGKMDLFMEIAGTSVDVPDCAYELTPEPFRFVTELIFSTINNYWEEMIEMVESGT